MASGAPTLQFWKVNTFISILCFKLHFRGFKDINIKIESEKNRTKREINFYQVFVYEGRKVLYLGTIEETTN